MAKRRNPINQCKEKQNPQKQHQTQKKPHSWAAVRSLFTCKYLQVQPHQPHVQHQQREKPEKNAGASSHRPKKPAARSGRKKQPVAKTDELRRTKCFAGRSLCNNTKVMQKPEQGPNPSTGRTGSSNNESLAAFAAQASPSNIVAGPFRSIPFRKLSGCYECRTVVDPVIGSMRDPSLRASICCCPECGEIFMKPQNLELHQAIRHAVSELGPDDTSKNIVEIIFQSSWLKKQAPVCKIDRILKVQNTPTTISRFEDYRAAIKAKATRHPKKHARCLADGNELLRFHCTTLTCSLGLNGSSNLCCGSSPTCGVCSLIKNGFKAAPDVSSKGILTTATSGKAHDRCGGWEVGDDHGRKRAMLVCRVIAGRVKKNPDGNSEDYDSVGGAAGSYSNLDELYVLNPKAILPCFVVIYGGF